MDNIETRLEAIRAELERINGRLSEGRRPEPLTLTKEDAAARLSISLTLLKRMIRDGSIVPVTVGKRAMIPFTELERIATPAPINIKRNERKPTRAAVSVGTGAQGALDVRAALRRAR